MVQNNIMGPRQITHNGMFIVLHKQWHSEVGDTVTPREFGYSHCKIRSLIDFNYINYIIYNIIHYIK